MGKLRDVLGFLNQVLLNTTVLGYEWLVFLKVGDLVKGKREQWIIARVSPRFLFDFSKTFWRIAYCRYYVNTSTIIVTKYVIGNKLINIQTKFFFHFVCFLTTIQTPFAIPAIGQRKNVRC